MKQQTILNQFVTPTVVLQRGMYGGYHLFISWGTDITHDPQLCPECIRPGSLNRVSDVVATNKEAKNG